MVKGLKLCALILGCGLVFGCAAQKSGKAAEEARVERFRHSYEASLNAEQEQAGQELLRHARSAIGTPYVLGGSNPGGFDCSGFVHWAYKNVGVKLPRTAREQSVVGEKIHNIEDMRAGDIVAFRHPKRGYHTGIYVGDGKFIHSPRKRTRVRINSLSDPYFSNTLLGARRVAIGSGENLVAQAESRLATYSETRKSGKTTSVASAAGSKSGKAAKAQRATKAAKSAAKSGKSAKASKAVSTKSGKKTASVASAHKATTGKTVKSAKASAKTTAAARNAKTTATKSAAAKSTAAKKAGHKTVSALHAKNSRGRS